MKGTLFSADFIKDNNGNLRLLEFNTDTAILTEEASNIDWSNFINILSENSITDIDVIYKPLIHDSFINSLSSSIQLTYPSINFNIHPEDLNTIYPSSVEANDTNFVLRLAYDESAIFDSTYCKGRLDLYKLYYDGSGSNMITEFYYSSSEELYNSLVYNINPSNIPDVSIKSIQESFNPIDFYKIGNSHLTNTERWSSFIDDNKTEDKLIEQYHFHSSSIDENGKITSYRTFFIIYGNELELLNIHSYKNSAIFELPTDISSEVDDSLITNKIGDHHYFEYTTNTFKIDGAGLLSTDKILMSDDTYKTFADVELGDEIKSFYISGSPQVENEYDTMTWYSEGSEYPSGSFMTSSRVVFKNVEDLHYNGLVEYVINGDSSFSGTAKQFLVFDSGSNKTLFKHATLLNPDTDYFFDIDGNIIDLDEVNFYITTDTDIKIVELDVEDTDTYIVSGSTSFNSIVSHNAPCFIAGTKISLPDGSLVNIEDVKIGDTVLTYNFVKNSTEPRVVRGVSKKTAKRKVVYQFSDGSELHATWDHPLYSPESGWVSYDPAFTMKEYQLKTEWTSVGTSIQKMDGSTPSIVSITNVEGDVVVYNLRSVEVNHNFYANEFLVHNRCFVAGTEITLSDGDVKNIEDVIVGDEVLTFNESNGKQETGIVGDLKQHEVNSVIRLTLDNENIIITTHEHPFFVEGKGWVKAGELESLDVCKKVDGSESLISTVEVLEETHTVYNLLSVSENHNFYANGILVHNK